MVVEATEPIVLASHEWRKQFGKRLDEAAQQRRPMIYTRHGKPVLVVFITPPMKLSERRLALQTMTILFNTTFDQMATLTATEALPRVRINQLRRDVTATFQELNWRLQPHVLTKYWDEIGFVVPVPAGHDMERATKLCEGYYHG